jgi:nucleotide-binding universal stress UspA family protein
MYKRILVAVDESAAAKRALWEAIQLARERPAQIRLVHVITWPIVPPHGGCPGAEESLSAYTAAQRAGQALLEQAASQAREAGLTPDTVVVESGGHSTSQALVEAAKRWPADLIILGTHGRRGLHHLILGSVAEGVVRLAPAPVLLVRQS